MSGKRLGRRPVGEKNLRINHAKRQRRYRARIQQDRANEALNILAPQSSDEDIPAPIPAQAAPIDLPLEWDRQEEDAMETPVESESEDSDSEAELVQVPLKHELGVIARESGWTQSSINKLLATLRARGLDLPKDSRTILGRDMVYDITHNGTLLYVGVANALDEVLGHHPDFANDTINLHFNSDGLPIYHAPGKGFTPLLMGTDVDLELVSIIHIHCDEKKLHDEIILFEDFVKEMLTLTEKAILVAMLIVPMAALAQKRRFASTFHISRGIYRQWQ